MTHDELCERARRWLSGTRQCNPVFSNCASCSEIPDAIGWASRWNWHGSQVVECKTSVGDFYADKQKYIRFKDKYGYIARQSLKQIKAAELGYEQEIVPRMGDFRFFMCLPDVISEALVKEHSPDHGLLYVEGRRVRTVIPAPRREGVNYAAEVRFLRFAIINSKNPYAMDVGEAHHEQTDVRQVPIPSEQCTETRDLE